MAKKIGVIFVLMSLVLITLSSSIYQFFIISYKKDFKSYLQSHSNTINTSKITIQKDQLNKNQSTFFFIDFFDEISYNEILYDIISKEDNGNELVLTVVKDIEDTDKREIYSLLFNEDDTDNKASKKIINELLSMKYLKQTNFEFQISHLKETLLQYIPFECSVKKVFLPQEYPPPLV